MCVTELPPLVPGGRGPGHLRRCHLADPETIYQTEVLAETDPEAAAAVSAPSDESLVSDPTSVE